MRAPRNPLIASYCLTATASLSFLTFWLPFLAMFCQALIEDQRSPAPVLEAAAAKCIPVNAHL